jgi:hypothetical protein
MYQLQRYSNLYILSLLLLLVSSCDKNITQRKRVFFENAEDGIASNMLATHRDGYDIGRIVRPFGGSNVIGNFNNTVVTVLIDSVPAHNMIYASFDLFTHDNWEGLKIGQYGLPDVWNIRVNGAYQLSTCFSNSPIYEQAYPEWIGTASLPARSNAVSRGFYGICALDTLADGTTHYRIVFSRPHTDKSVIIQFNDALQGPICDRSWSIDNISIEIMTN